jgi:hypothetical protein
MMLNAQSIGKTLMNVLMPEQTQGLRTGEIKEGGGTPPTVQTGSSFQDIFQLIDANTDLKLGTDELNIMSHLFMEGMVLAKDMDGDGALSAEEAGVPANLVTEVDTNQDNKIDGGELGSMTDNMLGSIIQALDKDQDQALSMKELALLYFIFGATKEPQPPESLPAEPVEGEEQAIQSQLLKKA